MNLLTPSWERPLHVTMLDYILTAESSEDIANDIVTAVDSEVEMFYDVMTMFDSVVVIH